MERIFKVGKVLRNNWKKSIFFSGLAAWAGKWAYDREIEFQIMRAYCEEAIKYGEKKIPPMLNSRHVTVILNPAANKKKSKADYEKYCEPLLNLAGLKVSIIQTEAEGQAKDLMEIMDNTDCVLIAGGDGTVHEAITGLLRRQDSPTAVKAYPIGIAPIGRRNFIAHRLNHFDVNDRKAKIIGESTMSLVREVLKDVNVMKIEGNQGRPVYSLGTINVGQIRNTFAKLDEYWYFGDRAKPYLTFFFQSFRNLAEYWNPDDDVNVSFTDPCSGCSKCVDKIFPVIVPEKQIGNDPQNRRWWHSLLSRRVEPKKKGFRELEIERMKGVENSECDHWKSVTLNSKNILIQNDLDNGRIQMLVHEDNIGTLDFIGEGVRFSKELDYVNNTVSKAAENPNEYLKNFAAKEIQLEMTGFPEIFDESVLPPKISEYLKTSTVDVSAENIQEQLSEDIDINQNNENDVEKANVSLNSNNIEDAKNISEEKIIERKRKIGGIQELDTIPAETTNIDENSENKNDNENENKDEDELDDSARWLYIDNENYAIPGNLRIELLQRRVQIYSPSIVNHSPTGDSPNETQKSL